MALDRKLGLSFVMAAFAAVTIVGCGGPATATGAAKGNTVTGAAVENEAGVKKKIPKNMSPAAQDAVKAMKGSEDP